MQSGRTIAINAENRHAGSKRPIFFRVVIFIAVMQVGSIFGWVSSSSSQSIKPAVSDAPSQSAPADVWSAFQERSPFPYALPLPPAVVTDIDGLYVKWEPMTGAHVHCLRCPDWIYEGGPWKIRFDRGVYRVLHTETHWRSIGSFKVSRDRLILFNDPACIDDIGVYRWKLESGVLTLQVIDDPCAIKLRGKNLEHLPWQSCRPPNVEAAVTDHWAKPKGCD